MSTNIIGKKIKEARIEANLSQLELSKALVVSEKAVSSYESGRTNPTIQTLQTIAIRTKKPLTYFTETNTEDMNVFTKLSKVQDQLDEIKNLLKNRKK